MNYGKENHYSVNVCIQSLCFGGKTSSFPKTHRENPHGCHSWRNDTVQAVVLDAFYDPFKENAYEFAKNWALENDNYAVEGTFSDYDRRFLWSTFGKSSDPDNGVVLDSVWDKYFDSE